MNIIESFNSFTEFFKFNDVLEIVHPQDREVVKHLNLEKFNAVIAGGAALSWYQKQSVDTKDIDVWFRKQKDHKLMTEYLRESTKVFSSNNADTYKIEMGDKEYRVQLIHNSPFESPVDLVNTFDITVSQIATDGYTWWYSDQFLADLKNKRLRITKSHNGSLKRLIKYWSYGFQPMDEDLKLITENPNTQWNFETGSFVDDYDNAF